MKFSLLKVSYVYVTSVNQNYCGIFSLAPNMRILAGSSTFAVDFTTLWCYCENITMFELYVS